MSTKNINVRHSELVSESSSFLNSKKLNQKISPHAFTLIELIVVVTILTILGAIGFVTMTGYFAGARDSARLSDMNSIYTQLNLTSGMEGSLPLPDNSRSIAMDGSSVDKIIAYQGYAGKTVLDTIKFEKGGRDPKDDVYYTYTIDKKKKQAQLMGYFEEYDTTKLSKTTDIIPKTYAAAPENYLDRKIGTLGKNIGTLLVSSTFAPVQTESTGTLDIASATNSYTAYFDTTTTASGAGTDLKIAYTNTSVIYNTGGVVKNNESTSFTCGSSTVTAGGFTYTTILGLDGHCWTSQNMRHLPLGNASQSNWCLENNPSNCTTYGRLYSWFSAMGLPETWATADEQLTNSVCSQLGSGWKLPTNDQWTALTNAGGTGWSGNKLGGILSSTPSLPGIYVVGGGYFDPNQGSWWSSTQADDWFANYRLSYGDLTFDSYGYSKKYGFSVVCIKN